MRCSAAIAGEDAERVPVADRHEQAVTGIRVERTEAIGKEPRRQRVDSNGSRAEREPAEPEAEPSATSDEQSAPAIAGEVLERALSAVDRGARPSLPTPPRRTCRRRPQRRREPSRRRRRPQRRRRRRHDDDHEPRKCERRPAERGRIEPAVRSCNANHRDERQKQRQRRRPPVRLARERFRRSVDERAGSHSAALSPCDWCPAAQPLAGCSSSSREASAAHGGARPRRHSSACRGARRSGVRSGRRRSEERPARGRARRVRVTARRRSSLIADSGVELSRRDFLGQLRDGDGLRTEVLADLSPRDADQPRCRIALAGVEAIAVAQRPFDRRRGDVLRIGRRRRSGMRRTRRRGGSVALGRRTGRARARDHPNVLGPRTHRRSFDDR